MSNSALPGATAIVTEAQSKKPTHYVNFTSPGTFVKVASFFEEQGGLTADWGKSWVPVTAYSIEHARVIALAMRRAA